MLVRVSSRLCGWAKLSYSRSILPQIDVGGAFFNVCSYLPALHNTHPHLTRKIPP